MSTERDWPHGPVPGSVSIEPAASVQGGVALPGDKSISHRAVLIGALGEGETQVRGFGRAADTESTIGAVRALGEHRRRVEQVEHALAEGDAGFLARWIAEASGNRRRMLAEAYEQPGALQRLRVHVPDRPGVLAGITQALGAERINIEDFELQHMSRERGGTLTLLVAGEDEAARAAGILEAQGYHVVISTVLDE
jgi:hypothetical protein